MQIIERKEQISYENVTVPVAASQMKSEQGVLTFFPILTICYCDGVFCVF